MVVSSGKGFICFVFAALVLLIAVETVLLSYEQAPRRYAYNSRLYSIENAPAVPSGKPSAIVTLVGGDSAARHAVALVQSLRDVNTMHRVVVLLCRGGIGSEACRSDEWKVANNRTGVDCSGPHTIGEFTQPLQLRVSSGLYLRRELQPKRLRRQSTWRHLSGWGPKCGSWTLFHEPSTLKASLEGRRASGALR